MQSRDDVGTLVHTEILPDPRKLTLPEQISALSKSLDTAAKKGGVSHVVAPLPKCGEIVEIHGLTYKVKNAFPGRGKLILQLEQPNE